MVDKALIATDDRPSLAALMKLHATDGAHVEGRHHHTNARQVIFGGQMLAQALSAAAARAPSDAFAHSLRVDFLRPGLADRALRYDCESLMSGRNITVVRVVASQDERLVMQGTTCFQRPQSGPDHQRPFPDGIPEPDQLHELGDVLFRNAHRVDAGILAATYAHIVDVRLCEGEQALFQRFPVPHLRYWVRVRHPLETPLQHQAALAYFSDLWFSLTALCIHQDNQIDGQLQTISLNHTVWFHTPARVDEWLLVDAQSPFAGNAHGLTVGWVYSRDGTLVATLAQEALFRRPSTEGGNPGISTLTQDRGAAGS
ncbi:acyl-CoA thioesterase domain-containing protein [Pseudoxanthomonas sp.]|uniref:acyl-CoA thioesterase n=1 Tax=Pseudoxanthomonas sp. TaxID=1871049 RepID=UPI00262B6DFC|nr:acyl-CoA thioesterase domain-containing protein [Pseudoxanthomonas sp.]WDS36939.1 MAG: thioesterase family protein [Pseudoxanthomonas sp.]